MSAISTAPDRVEQGSVGAPVDGAAVLGRADQRFAVLLTAAAFVALTVPDAFGFSALLPLVALLLVGAAHLVLRSGRPIRAVVIPAALMPLGVWLLATTPMSQSASVTAIRAGCAVAVLLLACLIGTVAEGRSLLVGVVLGGVAVVAVSLAVAAIQPSVGLMPAGYQGGALRGLYSHRNVLAEVLAPAVVAALVARFRGRAHRARWWAAAVVVLAGLLLTRASTALVSIATVVALVAVLEVARRRPPAGRALLMAGAVVLAGLLGVVAALNSGFLLGLLGRDETLTSRTPIWRVVQSLIAQHPIVGWGWGATWNDGDSVRQQVSATVGFDVPSAHDGYLDVWLQAGAVGLVVFGIVLAVILVRGIVGFVRTGDRFAEWGIALAIGLLVYNVTEASVVSYTSLFLLAATATILVRAGRAARAGRSDAEAISAQAASADPVGAGGR